MQSKIIWLVLLLGLVFVGTSVNGQDISALSLITPENASKIVPVSALESTYLGSMAWSNDGNWLAL